MRGSVVRAHRTPPLCFDYRSAKRTTSEIEAQAGRTAVSTPRPGRAVRGSRTGRPIMAALDLLGRRWTLRVLWELRDGSAASFRELRERCDTDVHQRAEPTPDRAARSRPDRHRRRRLPPHKTRRGAARGARALDAWAKRWRATPQGKGSAKKSAAGRRATPPPEGPRRRRGPLAVRPGSPVHLPHHVPGRLPAPLVVHQPLLVHRRIREAGCRRPTPASRGSRAGSRSGRRSRTASRRTRPGGSAGTRPGTRTCPSRSPGPERFASAPNSVITSAWFG